MNNKKITQYVAGVCFAILTVLLIVDGVETLSTLSINSIISNSIPYLAHFIGLVLITVSLFISNPILMTVGSAVNCIYSAFILWIYFRFWYIHSDVLSCARCALYLIIWLLLLAAGIKQSSSKTIGLISGAIAAIRCLLCFITMPQLSRHGLGGILVLFIGTLLFGLSSPMTLGKVKASPVQATVPLPAQNAESQIERLTKLKSFLDKGIITQEEFDAKKKQILS